MGSEEQSEDVREDDLEAIETEGNAKGKQVIFETSINLQCLIALSDRSCAVDSTTRIQRQVSHLALK